MRMTRFLDLEDVNWAGKLALIEALLFASPDPVTVEQLAEAGRLTVVEVKEILAKLGESLSSPSRGLMLREVAGGYRLYTKPEMADAVVRLRGPRSLGLSQAALETLAVVAYRQPATRAEVDAVRGVRSDSTVATLLERHLVREDGRRDALGRPIIYVTTPQFLEHFGLKSLADLPPLKEVEEKAALLAAGSGRARTLFDTFASRNAPEGPPIADPQPPPPTAEEADRE
jgi:segregation and condensation protein B